MKIVKGKPDHSIRSVSFAQAITQLVDLGLDLVPLKAAGKVPIERSWPTPVQRQIGAVTGRFVDAAGGDPSLPASAYCAQFANVGILNESSKTVVLDCDDPRALAALRAAALAAGETFDPKALPGYWQSIKGPKVLFSAPSIMYGVPVTARRAVFRVWNRETNHFDVIFELRGTGQDVIPPSVRDVDGKIVALHWTLPAKLSSMPDWLAMLYTDIGHGNTSAEQLMMSELGIHKSDWGKSEQYGGFTIEYPRELAVHGQARIFCRSNFDVPALLKEYGYEKHGVRWRPNGSTSAPGIMAERGKFMWRCEHENAIIHGPFDAWRLIVAHKFHGDIRAALAWYAQTLQEKLTRKKPDSAPIEESGPEPEPDQDDAVGMMPKRVLNEAPQIEPTPPILSGSLSLRPGMHLLASNPKAGKSILATVLASAMLTGKSETGFVRNPELGHAGSEVFYGAFDEDYAADTMPRLMATMEQYGCGTLDEVNRAHFFRSPEQIVDWAIENNMPIYQPLGVAGDMMSEEDADEKYNGDKFMRPVFNTAVRAMYFYLKTFRLKLAVLDLAGAMITQSTSRENVARIEYASYVALEFIGREVGCAIVGLAHYNKAVGTQTTAPLMPLHSKIAGTNGLLGALSSLIGLDPLQGPDDDDIFNIEPVGRKIQIEQIGRGIAGVPKTAFSLQMNAVDGCTSPGFTLAYVGRPELLAQSDVRQWVLHYLADFPPADYTPMGPIHTAARSAGAYDGVLRSFKKIVMSMSKAGDLEGKHGAGYRLSAAGRAKTARTY